MEFFMKLFEVLKKQNYFLLAVFSSILMLAVYIYTQLLGIIENIGVWLATIPLHNAVLLIIFTILFGVTSSYQVFLWRQPKTCSVNKKISTAGTGGIGTFGIFLVAQCPACASLSALFLPISVLAFFSEFSWLINLVSIGLLLFTLNYLGGFKKTGAKK